METAEGDDTRRITHVTVFAPDGFGPGEIAALTGLRDLTWDETRTLLVQLIGLGKPADFRHRLFGPATTWDSATPFVGPRHSGRGGRERDLLKALRREVRRAGERELLPAEAVSSFQIERLNPPPGSPWPLEFRRSRERRGDDGYERPCALVRLRFPVPVPGPLCLGYASHFGLGLFLSTGQPGGGNEGA